MENWGVSERENSDTIVIVARLASDLSRDCTAHWSEVLIDGFTTTRGYCRGTRARPSVVWKSCGMCCLFMDCHNEVSLLFRQWTGGLIYVGEKIPDPLSQCVFLGLNEGFASWIEYLAVDKCYPEFDIWTQFVADTFARFLVPDALKSSHPIEVPIGKWASWSSCSDDLIDGIFRTSGGNWWNLRRYFLFQRFFRHSYVARLHRWRGVSQRSSQLSDRVQLQEHHHGKSLVSSGQSIRETRQWCDVLVDPSNGRWTRRRFHQSWARRTIV